jgi:hypothetical protein
LTRALKEKKRKKKKKEKKKKKKKKKKKIIFTPHTSQPTSRAQTPLTSRFSQFPSNFLFCMERQQHSHNFHLFRWNKLVGAPSGDSIVRVAIGGLEGHELVAALLDSNELLLRLVSDGVLLAKHVRLSVNPSFSAVRGLAFDRSAQWLMLICDDLTVGLLPVFVLLRGATTAAQSAHHRQQQQFLLQQQLQRQQETGGADKLLQRLGLKKTPSQQANLSKLPFSDLQDLTVITPRVAGRTGATGCIWWYQKMGVPS